MEPFRDADPGPHVRAAQDAVRAAGVPLEVGPFGSAVEGPADAIAAVVGRLIGDAVAHGASRVSLQVTTLD